VAGPAGKRAVVLRLDADELALADALAAAVGCSRHRLLRAALQLAGDVGVSGLRDGVEGLPEVAAARRRAEERDRQRARRSAEHERRVAEERAAKSAARRARSAAAARARRRAETARRAARERAAAAGVARDQRAAELRAAGLSWREVGAAVGLEASAAWKAGRRHREREASATRPRLRVVIGGER
jgi:hypothetical protein